jgi:hypothetical protein
MLKEWRRLDEQPGYGRFIHIHPAWFSFIKYCESLKYGEIERLKVQDGIPVMAEVVRSKVRFTD